ncbi:MAG: ATP-binding protein [Chlorobi bacterium]|nr:ATP-binding protein [Chlorobiota bacterium]
MDKQRFIYANIVKHLRRKEFTIVTGARQTGKTTILKQLFKHLKAEGKKVWLITFEKEEILRGINKDPENIFQFTSRPKNPLFELQDEPFYILVDEVQYASNPSNFLKYLYDTYQPHLKIIATGSSSFYLDTKFKDSLSGRKRIFTLPTLSFDEYLIFKERQYLFDELQQIRETPEYKSLQHIEIMQMFDDYILYGGYPEVVLAETRKDKLLLLEEIKNSYIKRDIFESKVENEQKFYQLLVVLASQTGNLLNKFELSKSLRIDVKTVDRYINVLQKCFHITIINPFHRNLKKELLKMPKVFLNDLGLRNLLINNFIDIHIRSDKGQLFENYVFLRLMQLYREDEIKFWRTADQKEVDFVVNTSTGTSLALEVKFSPDNLNRKKYNKFIQSYPDIPLSYVTYETNEIGNVSSVLKI